MGYNTGHTIHTRSFMDSRSGNTNVPPFRNPSAYSRTIVKCSYLHSDEPKESMVAHVKYLPEENDLNKITNKALNKVYEQLDQAESLRVAWIERQKTIDMVTSGVRTLIRVARAVKRRDPKIVRAILGKNPDSYDVLKTPSSIWLAYHFGILPTISDIHHGMNLFTSALPPIKIEGTSGGEVFHMPPLEFNYIGGGRYIRELGWGAYSNGTCRVKLGCKLVAFDPNLKLATSLGLGQPLSVAWELTTMSWFVDYFVNVGEYIKNFEPRFPALTLKDHYWTIFSKVDGIYGGPLTDGWTARMTANYVHIDRKTYWPAFSLTFTSPADLKGQQASYSIAVLIQLLSGFKK